MRWRVTGKLYTGGQSFLYHEIESRQKLLRNRGDYCQERDNRLIEEDKIEITFVWLKMG